MKSLKILGFLLGLIILSALILNFTSPKDVDFNESAMVYGSSERIWQEVENLKAISRWQPVTKLDSAISWSPTGDDGVSGSVLAWESKVRRVGKGEFQLKEVIPNKRVELHVKSIKPMKVEMDKYLNLESVGDSVKITWGVKTHASFPNNIMIHFNEKEFRSDLKSGLDLLRQRISPKKQSSSDLEPSVKKRKYKISEISRPEIIYLMKRQKMKISQLEGFMSENAPNIYRAIAAAGGEIVGNNTGLYFDWNEEDKTTDMAVAVPLQEAINIEGYNTYVQPPGKCLKLSFKGTSENSYDAHMAMDKYMKDNGYEQNGLVVEEYLTDLSKVKKSDLMKIDIYYYVGKK